MFDENGERYQRRAGDPFWLKLAPVGSGLALALFGWGVSVENRIGTIQAIQAERTIKVAAIEERISEVAKAAYDPAPKPQAKVMIDQLEVEHTRMDSRLDRLEERFNNFHQFLIQTKPVIVPPSKRGALPFKPEDQG